MHTSYTYARILYKGVIILAGCVGAGKGVGGEGGGHVEESFMKTYIYISLEKTSLRVRVIEYIKRPD